MAEANGREGVSQAAIRAIAQCALSIVTDPSSGSGAAREGG